jgi:phospholipid/cholesterol/gamma-HCH transport system ATP-binding protein
MPDLRIPIQSLGFEQVTIQHEGAEPILTRCDFEFPMNEILRLRSSEGAGKSTLLQVLAGLDNIQEGHYWINKMDVADMSFEEFLPYRLNIGYSFDYGGLINNRTIYDNLMLPLEYHHLITPSAAKERVMGVLEKFEITNVAKERPAHVPGRIRKLTCILRALITEPQVLLLDDPSVGLGFETTQIFIEHLQGLRSRGVCSHVIIGSYDDRFMGALPHRVLYLEGQKIQMEELDPMKKVVHL